MKRGWVALLATVPILTGCGLFAAPVKSAPTIQTAVKRPHHVTIKSAPVAYVPPQMTLPKTIVAHLAPYARRVQSVIGPPFTVAAKGAELLYVSPASGYAIAQFAVAWRALAVKPAVVWINTNTTIAEQEWAAEGYKSDPLPSPQTFYTLTDVLSPAAFVHTKRGWLELAGVLRPSQVQDWISFFTGTGTAPAKKSI